MYHKVSDVMGRLIADPRMILTNEIVEKSLVAQESLHAKMANVVHLKILSVMGRRIARIILMNKSVADYSE